MQALAEPTPQAQHGGGDRAGARPSGRPSTVGPSTTSNWKGVGAFEVDMSKELGRGTTASVRLARRKGTDAYCAAKIIPIALLTANVQANNQVRREISILTQMQHHNVVRLSDVLYTQNNCYIMMELVSGGTLHDALIDHISVHGGGFSEGIARHYFRQLVVGLQYVHGRQVAHRDLKPSNLLVDSDGVLKVTDFGLATIQSDASRLSTMCGTPHYVAPEVLSRVEYCGKKADVWSCGVILYTMLAMRVPFDDENLKYHQYEGLWSKIRRGTFSMPSHLSDGVQQLLRSMLEVQPERRLTMDELAAHSWVTGSAIYPGPSGHPHEGAMLRQSLPPPAQAPVENPLPPGPSLDAFDVLSVLLVEGGEPHTQVVGLYGRPLNAAVADVAAVLQRHGVAVISDGLFIRSAGQSSTSSSQPVTPFVVRFLPVLCTQRTLIIAAVERATSPGTNQPHPVLPYTVHLLRRALFGGEVDTGRSRPTEVDGKVPTAGRGPFADDHHHCIAR